jgi:hypothetical protein
MVWDLSLTVLRYALNQGATTIAVDIESTEQDSRTPLPEIGSTGVQKLKFRSRQRRYKQIFQDEMSTSKILRSTAVGSIINQFLFSYGNFWSTFYFG